ncbi:hypothetical protein GWN63_04080, partial [Candidatus Bathyarchaeota archaeon]|nr:hypothetical protein [Candidatus Bathyarchaeota archaeon]NIR17891.1 hypothetical protein [Desulfobacterales bacterium]NIU81408.1 hypothetical protein [Candidatus Bathyarchaeota archaeon]NIV68229.1 hypothetical protein [Candidatus Bathyarchaeota archaeon]NIW16589.1 hypothetical protein [Candidatus Bathyarchaeota archaeon]
MSRPTIGIIGMGPVGSILAAHLAKSGEDVVAEDILEKILSKIRSDGLRVSGIKSFSVKMEKTAKSLSRLSEYNPDIIFI